MFNRVSTEILLNTLGFKRVFSSGGRSDYIYDIDKEIMASVYSDCLEVCDRRRHMNTIYTGSPIEIFSLLGETLEKSSIILKEYEYNY